MSRRLLPNLISGAICTILAAAATHAQPSTSRGQISVAQLKAMLAQAATNSTAHQVLTAYLAAAGETAGLLMDAAREQGLPLRPCARKLTLDANLARDAIDRVADTPQATETPATPLVVRAMLKGAGCPLSD